MHLEKWFFWPRPGKPLLSTGTPPPHQPHFPSLVPEWLGKLRPSIQAQTLTSTHPARPPMPPAYPATTQTHPLEVQSPHFQTAQHQVASEVSAGCTEKARSRVHPSLACICFLECLIPSLPSHPDSQCLLKPHSGQFPGENPWELTQLFRSDYSL